MDYRYKELEEKEEYQEKIPEANPISGVAALHKDLEHNKAIDQVDLAGLEKPSVIHMWRTHMLHLRRYMWRSRMGKEMRKRRVKRWRRCLTRDKEPGMDTWMGLEFGMSHQWRVRKQKKK